MMDRRGIILALGVTALGVGNKSPAAISAPNELIELYLDVINVWKRHDIDAVLSHMADDIIWYVHVGDVPIVGKRAVRTLLQTMAPSRSGERWRVFNCSVHGQKLFVEGVDDFDDASGHRIVIPYMGIVEFREGLIIGWRDYFDEALVKGMQSGGPIPAEIDPLVSRRGRP